MKSVLRSVKPYWFYLICEGIKKIEVGKTAPQSDEWDNAVYLYCSKDMRSFSRIPEQHREKYRKYLGMVGAKFVCDKVKKYASYKIYDLLVPQEIDICKVWDKEMTGLTYNELCDYGKGKPPLRLAHLRPQNLRHAANAVDKDGNPCCAICAGSTPDAFIVAEKEIDLTGRKARCWFCGSLKDSSPDLPFFEHRHDREFDRFYDGCKGWD